MARLAADFAFGAVWARPGLKPDQRSLVTLGILIAQSHPAEIRNHFRIALVNGLTPAELEEVVLQTVPYVGFPAASTATTVLIEVLREGGESRNTSTPEESGLL
jgi:4-carboxymuconolactone decarboxylase